MVPTISSARPAVPPAVSGIDVNHCKNPRCANFGVPADIVKYRRKAGSALASSPGTAYKLVAVGKSRPALQCLLCNESFSIKSNLAIAEERERFSRYLAPTALLCCATPGCANKSIPVSDSAAYQRFGTTKAGSPRWRCRLCKKTVTGAGRALKKQRITHLNKTVLLALTNKMPLRRIMKVTGLNAVTLYGKIDFLHRQCLAFSAWAERDLPKLERSRLYISVDRQDYMVNWSRDSDRRNIMLRAIGSACNDTSYVFGMHLNFDPAIDPTAMEDEAKLIGDNTTPYPHRKFARLWLLSDYAEALKQSAAEKLRRGVKATKGLLPKTLDAAIADAYEATALRDDTEVSELKDEDQKLPDARGAQVHEEYSIYGHFFFLKQALAGVQKLRFFLDQDSGMRAACLSAFRDDIKARRVDAFYVRTAKELTIGKKRAEISKSRAAFRKACDAYPDANPDEVMVAMMRAEIDRAATIGKWGDRWCLHPFPDMSEPSKAMCWLTDLEGYDDSHVARLFLRSSLRGVDNFFQRVRRRVNPLERPIQTASRGRRTWYGHSPYNPALVEKLLTIYRVMHNFVEIGKDGRTPAMRIGLTGKPYAPDNIIYLS